MNKLLLPNPNTGLRRLLGGWRDVLDDIRALCRALQDLPDVCQCGHRGGHQQGSCPCCGSTAVVRVPACDDCEAQLANLRPAMDVLTVDTLRFFPFVKELLARDDAAASERVREIERHIATLVHSFEQLVVAAGRFRSDCRVSHLKTLRDSALALRRDAEALNRVVSPQSELSYVKD